MGKVKAWAEEQAFDCVCAYRNKTISYKLAEARLKELGYDQDAIDLVLSSEGDED